jgi:hypothetical protein
VTSLPTTLNVDADGYPDDAALEQIRTADATATGARWMVETFPKLAAELAPYGQCGLSENDDEHFITFVTLGWSGCEDFIAAVLGNGMLRGPYYSAWRRTGWHEFRVRREAVGS